MRCSAASVTPWSRRWRKRFSSTPIARASQASFELKGASPLTENYSVLRPEVLEDEEGKEIATRNEALLEKLLSYDALIVAGQAKSHCVSWTLSDLLEEIRRRNT